jgi:hypothetical protein
LLVMVPFASKSFSSSINKASSFSLKMAFGSSGK